MDGYITIRLKRNDPCNRSSLPDLAFDANWLARELPGMEYTTDGFHHKIGEKYDIEDIDIGVES